MHAVINYIDKNIMKSILFTVLLSLTFQIFSSSPHYQKLFAQWQIKHGKSYAGDQVQYRLAIFQQNLNIINKHNSDSTKAYKVGINKFTGYTRQQFKNKFLGLKSNFHINAKVSSNLAIQSQVASEVQAGSSITTASNQSPNWASRAGAVKNQGGCGSCWSFTANGVVQAAYHINKGEKIVLSEQQLVDCTLSLGNDGCKGGDPEIALQYIQQNHVTTLANYPYTSGDTGVASVCHNEGTGYSIKQIKYSYHCSGILKELKKGPIAVTVDASSCDWFSYTEGIFHCSKSASINHAVLLVGVDKDNNWLVKNQWGPDWGMNGYIWLQAGNTCGVCDQPGISVYL